LGMLQELITQVDLSKVSQILDLDLSKQER